MNTRLLKVTSMQFLYSCAAMQHANNILVYTIVLTLTRYEGQCVEVEIIKAWLPVVSLSCSDFRQIVHTLCVCHRVVDKIAIGQFIEISSKRRYRVSTIYEWQKYMHTNMNILETEDKTVTLHVSYTCMYLVKSLDNTNTSYVLINWITKLWWWWRWWW